MSSEIPEPSRVNLSPEVYLDEEKLYLVRQDTNELFFVNTSHQAILAIDSIAHVEQTRLEKERGERTRVFRQDFEDGKRVVISTQDKGYLYDGSIVKEIVLDYVEVSHAVIKRGRLELSVDASVDVSVETPAEIPTQEQIALAIEQRRGELESPGSESESSSDDE